jgi:hypothetical protein
MKSTSARKNFRGDTAWLEGAGVVAPGDILLQVTKQPANTLRLDDAWSYSHTRKDETRPASVAVRLRLVNPGVEPW